VFQSGFFLRGWVVNTHGESEVLVVLRLLCRRS
jgi:hypothetical protein